MRAMRMAQLSLLPTLYALDLSLQSVAIDTVEKGHATFRDRKPSTVVSLHEKHGERTPIFSVVAALETTPCRCFAGLAGADDCATVVCRMHGIVSMYFDESEREK